jgi:hypothetical protein
MKTLAFLLAVTGVAMSASAPVSAQSRGTCFWINGGSILGAKIIKPADAGKWFDIDGAVIQLADPFDPEYAGMAGRSIVIQQSDAASNGSVIAVTGGGERIRLPNGSEVTSWNVPFETGTKPLHVFRITASTKEDGPAWFVTEGP